MSPCHPFRPVPGQCGPHRRGPLPAPPFDPRDYWATRKLVSSLSGALEKKLDKADVVDPGAAAEAGKAADAKSTYEELGGILAKLAKKADKATTLEGYGITDAATKTEIAAKADLVGGKVPAAQLPSYVDEVLEYGSKSEFPASGESGRIYVAKDTNLVYRWSGTQYVEISPSPVLDDAVTETSSNGVKSSGIWSWVKSLLPKWLTSDYAEPATAASVAAKADKIALEAHVANTNNPHAVTAAQVGSVPFVDDSNGEKTAVTIGSRKRGDSVSPHSLANGDNVSASGISSHAEGIDTTASGNHSHAEGGGTVASGEYSHAEGGGSTASGKHSHAEGVSTVASGEYSHAEGLVSTASGLGSHAEGDSTTASGYASHAGGVNTLTRKDDTYAYAWNSDSGIQYTSHGPGTFNINPVGGIEGFYLGEQTLPQVISAAITGKANKVAPSAAGNLAALTADGDLADSGKTVDDFLPRVSDGPVRSTFDIAGPLFLDMDGYIQLRAAGFIYGLFDNIREEAGSPNSLRTELDSKVDSFWSVGGASATVENGVAKLDDFFTGSNSLLTSTIEEKSIPAFSSSSTYEVGEIVIYGGVAYKCVKAITPAEEWTAAHWTAATDSDLANRLKGFKSDGNATDGFATDLLGKKVAKDAIDAEIIEKGTAPDAHLEVPTDTDDRLKLILADNSVAYDSAKALPYKLTSVIGDRVVATMTLNAASTDITLPTIAANDTTVKDFILDVTNAYAVEGVATDACINIPRTDVKLVTRDGESLTDVTTVKAGKSAFICFTQKSPVVVDGTTYPCWCVIQLPFGDPS